MTLPDWPARTVAVLATCGEGPHSIPVSAPVRAAPDRVLISLRRERASLARLRADPRAALTVLAEGDVAFTVRGRAQVVEEPMAADPGYAAVAIAAEQIDDHRQAAFRVTAGVGRDWVDADEQAALGARVRALSAAR
jgi:Pyridoxamine 5'-phosphate oxidase